MLLNSCDTIKTGAMSNSRGGIIIVGVKDKTGEIIGLDYGQLRKTGQLAADVATNNVLPLIYIETEAITIDKGNGEKAKGPINGKSLTITNFYCYSKARVI
jgi:hypothetical protein